MFAVFALDVSEYRTMSLFFFFFQAEDGIRDVAVTGVQTCALPISRRQIARLGVERFQKSMERAGGHRVHVRVVHIILLDLLQNFAVNRQRFVGLVVRGSAQDVTYTRITKDQYG